MELAELPRQGLERGLIPTLHISHCIRQAPCLLLKRLAGLTELSLQPGVLCSLSALLGALRRPGSLP